MYIIYKLHPCWLYTHFGDLEQLHNRRLIEISAQCSGRRLLLDFAHAFLSTRSISGAVGSITPPTPAVGTAGTITATVGTLTPGQSAVVTFGVKILP